MEITFSLVGTSAVLFKCSLCHAAVDKRSTTDHTAWHVSLLESMAQLAPPSQTVLNTHHHGGDGLHAAIPVFNP